MRAKGFSVKRNGRFAVLGVKTVRETVHNVTGREAAVHRMPTENDPSHSGVLGYSSGDTAVESELSVAVASSGHVFPGVGKEGSR